MIDFFDLCRSIQLDTVLHTTQRGSQYILLGFEINRKDEEALKYRISENNSKRITKNELNILWNTLFINKSICFNEIENQYEELFRSGDCYKFIFLGLVRILYPELIIIKKESFNIIQEKEST